MKLEVKILDDDGKVLAEHTADACQPSMWRAMSTQKLLGKMPQTSDQVNTGTYELFGVTFQPHVRVDRPNGWKESPPGPLTGQPSTGLMGPPSFPTGFQTGFQSTRSGSSPGFGWQNKGTFAPTNQPQKQTQPLTGRVPGLRG
jgi:hypothetical protein